MTHEPRDRQGVVYYNEFDRDAATQLRAYIDAGLIAPGDVDERSIEDVKPGDLRGYRQVHLFAGIGGWSLALRLAGWPDDQPIWTGSCPCQPFSQAGAGAGFADERHLWPAMQHLIAQCRPAVVAGEQVASRDADPWLDLVCDDLEGMGYAYGAIAFPSASVGAPHIRDRTYWLGVANADSEQWDRRIRAAGLASGWPEPRPSTAGCGDARGLGDSGGQGCSELARRWQQPAGLAAAGVAGGLADAGGERHDGQSVRVRERGQDAVVSETSGRGAANGFWSDAEWIRCRDEKLRPVEPGSFPLAHGLPRSLGALGPELAELARLAGLSQQSLAAAKRYRVRQLKGYGNAINPWQAAEFVRAAMAHIGSLRANQSRRAA